VSADGSGTDYRSGRLTDDEGVPRHGARVVMVSRQCTKYRIALFSISVCYVSFCWLAQVT
jgi:hypothetical protein